MRTLRSPSTCFFIVWYFWLESTIFETKGWLDRLMMPQRLFPSLCCCFSLSSLIYMFMKWICFSRFSMYSSSILRLGFKPKIGELAFSLEMPTGIMEGCTFIGPGAFGKSDLWVVLLHGIRNYYKTNLWFKNKGNLHTPTSHNHYH